MALSSMPIFGPWILCSSLFAHSMVMRMLSMLVVFSSWSDDTYESMSPSTFVKKLVIFSDKTFKLSPRSSS